MSAMKFMRLCSLFVFFLVFAFSISALGARPKAGAGHRVAASAGPIEPAEVVNLSQVLEVKTRHQRKILKSALGATPLESPIPAFGEFKTLFGQDVPINYFNATGLLNELKGKSLIDFGAGKGHLAAQALLFGASSVVAVDINPACIDETKKTLALYKQETGHKFRAFVLNASEKLPDDLLAKPVDFVFSNKLVHFLSPRQLESHFENVYRVLKPGGRFYFTITPPHGTMKTVRDHAFANRLPNPGYLVGNRSSADGWQYVGASDYKELEAKGLARLYLDESEVKDRLHKANFKVLSMKYVLLSESVFALKQAKEIMRALPVAPSPGLETTILARLLNRNRFTTGEQLELMQFNVFNEIPVSYLNSDSSVPLLYVIAVPKMSMKEAAMAPCEGVPSSVAKEEKAIGDVLVAATAEPVAAPSGAVAVGAGAGAGIGAGAATAPTSEPDKISCAFCGKIQAQGEELSKCGRCKKARYCNKGCQTAHWSVHKPSCKP
jgi:ubiquinone/menaquinone biosynthesis C-methylase UbiE